MAERRDVPGGRVPTLIRTGYEVTSRRWISQTVTAMAINA